METTFSTLADALLDDLNDLSDVEPQDDMDNEGSTTADDDVLMDDGDSKPAATTETNNSLSTTPHEPSTQTSSSNSVSLLESPGLQNHLTAVRESEALAVGETTTTLSSPLDPHDYNLLRQANHYLAQLGDELIRAHARLCRLYHAKFPELEELLPQPVQYQNAVRVLGNATDLSSSRVTDALTERHFLSNNQILTISVAGSTTSGRMLTTPELNEVTEACEYMDKIVAVQNELTRFVQKRMQALAPSVCALLGSSDNATSRVQSSATGSDEQLQQHGYSGSTLAARIVGLAGGLEELSKIPACNLQVLGQTKQNSASRAGFSSFHGTASAGGALAGTTAAVMNRPHQGILAEADLVQRCPRHLQKKALKTVAAKLALAARCDFVNISTGRPRDATPGMEFYREIEAKLTKWQEPDKAPVLKALPKPDLTIRKRRGGKRIRRLKERFEETAMMKQANTRAFSAQSGEYGDDAMGVTMGLLDTADAAASGVSGSLRRRTEKRKMRFANTKASRKRSVQLSAAAAQFSGSGSSVNDLASSMVFTPVQGMELVNPDANKDRVRAANKKWFSENAGFVSALPKK